VTTLTLETPRKLAPLLARARYKAAHGGRGGAKSHFFAKEVIKACYVRRARVVCIREVQNSIKDSVKQLLVNKINAMGLGWAFEVLEQEIRGLAGTPAEGALIIFRGMQAYNAENIKSLEDFDIAWVEEAQALSERSLRLLRPTIRKAGSELWFSWNPRYETDAVDEFFRGDSPPNNALIVEIGWQDNPWIDDILLEEKDLDYRRNKEMADHVWGGGYEIITEGAYYASLIADAEREGRCGDFPYNPVFGVRTGWDIGVDDYSAVWFIQDDGIEATVIDYFESNGLGAQQVIHEALPEYLSDPIDRMHQQLAIGRPKLYRYDAHFFPHDVKVREWAAGARTRIQSLMAGDERYGVKGMKEIRRGANQGPEERISAVRLVLPRMKFNTGKLGAQLTPAQKRVKAGLNRLRRYARQFNEALNTYTTVAKHDSNSHGADAFGEWAINAQIIAPVEPKKERQIVPPGHIQLPPPPDYTSSKRMKI